MRIGILNAYDGRNFGDRAIVEAQRAWLALKFPGSEIRIFSHHFAQNQQIWKHESVRSIVGIPPKGSALQRLAVPIKDWMEYRLGFEGEDDREFLACDFYALCGGGYLYSSLTPAVSRNLWVHCINAQEALRTDKPVLQFPQSFGPLTKPFDCHIVRKLASALPLLTPRDESSMELLESMGFGSKSILVPDIAFGLRRFRPDWFQEAPLHKGLGIAPVDFRFAMPTNPKIIEEYTAKLLRVGVEYHQKTGEPIHVFSQVAVAGDDDDTLLARQLYRALQEKGVPAFIIDSEGELKNYLRHFQGLRAFIGCRMHSCIFALVSGVPTLGLSYQPKFRGAFQHVGFPDWSTSIATWTPEWISKRLDCILKNETAFRQQIKEKVQQLETRIDQSLTDAVARCQNAVSV